MAFARPTLKELVARVRSDIRAALQITAILRRSFLSAISRAIAGVANSLHGHLTFISKQAFPDQATGVYLKRWGSIYGVPAREATFSKMTITGTGVNGSILASADLFQIDSGLTYEVDENVEVSAGIYTANVTAVTEGAGSNLANGERMSLQSPVAGIDSNAVVASTVIEGENSETELAQQARIVRRIQFPPAGGNVFDYIAWALEVSGVSRVWVFPGNRGQGTVDVSFLELDATDEVIPGASKVAEVQEKIDESKPVTADSNVFAPNSLTIPMTIKLKPNTTATRLAVSAELKDLFIRDSQVSGAADPDKIASGDTFDGIISISKINEAISLATDEEDHVLVIPTADIGPDQGYIAVLGTITFQTLV